MRFPCKTSSILPWCRQAILHKLRSSAIGLHSCHNCQCLDMSHCAAEVAACGSEVPLLPGPGGLSFMQVKRQVCCACGRLLLRAFASPVARECLMVASDLVQVWQLPVEPTTIAQAQKCRSWQILPSSPSCQPAKIFAEGFDDDGIANPQLGRLIVRGNLQEILQSSKAQTEALKPQTQILETH